MMLALGGLPQLPDPAVWNEFPIIAVIVLVFAAAATAIAGFVKWFWTEYKNSERERRLFEDEQNKFRETAQDRRDRQWQQLITDIETRRDQNDERRDEKLSESMNILNGHDIQGRQVLEVVKRTDERVTRMEPKVDMILEAVKQPTVARKGPSGK